MGIFIASIVLTVIIAGCFLKKKFWENRYMVLLIGSAVAMIGILIFNYSTRGDLGTRTSTNNIFNEFKTFYVPDSLLVEKGKPVTNTYIFSYELDNDSIHNTVLDSGYLKTNFIIYIDTTSANHQYFGYINKRGKYKIKNLDDLYLAPSENDSIGTYDEMRLYYRPNTTYVAGWSMLPKKVYKCMHISPTAYAMLPDSLIRKLPF